MRIGNIKHIKRGSELQKNKRYFGIEILRYSPYKIYPYGIKPYVCIFWLKYSDSDLETVRRHGLVQNSRWSFIKSFEFPYSISIEIRR